MTDIRFDFSLMEHGWVDLHVRAADRTYTVEGISDVLDPMDDFIRTGRCALEGQPKMAVRFFHEPPETRWIVDPHALGVGQGDIEVRVLGFADLTADRPDEEGELLFRFNCDGRVYARAVCNALGEFLTSRRTEYERGWGEFPVDSYTWLKEAVSR